MSRRRKVGLIILVAVAGVLGLVVLYVWAAGTVASS